MVLGSKHYYLTVISLPFLKEGILYVNTRCECGSIKIIATSHLGSTRSCGCWLKERLRSRNTKLNLSRRKTYSGQRFGQLTIVGDRKPKDKRILTRCDCGILYEPFISSLLAHKTTHCLSSLHSKPISDRNVKSEYYYLYIAFRSMKSRCYRTSNPNYKNYGGRGIKVNFENFEAFKEYILTALGPRPAKGYSIDRYPNNDGDYERGNLRWATMQEQSKNRRTRVTMTKEQKDLWDRIQIGGTKLNER